MGKCLKKTNAAICAQRSDVSVGRLSKRSKGRAGPGRRTHIQGQITDPYTLNAAVKREDKVSLNKTRSYTKSRTTQQHFQTAQQARLAEYPFLL